MKLQVAETLFNLQQKVVTECLLFAQKEENNKLKEELLEASRKMIEIEKIFLVHIPRD